MVINIRANRLVRSLFTPDITLQADAHYAGEGAVIQRKYRIPPFWGNSDFARQGLMTEAVSAITHFAFERLDLRRIEAFSDDENEACWRVCERAGYVYEGTLRNTRLYSMIR